MHRIQSEKGAVLLVFVLLLIMGSAGVMVEQGMTTRLHGGASDAAPYLTAEQNIQRLNLAKEALLAAAVTYADNYGPRGAGPGHFPCPDLDPPDDGNAGNDGPNPPCGRVEKQVGRVPRLTLATRADLESADSTATQSPLNKSKLLEFYPQLSFQDRQPWYVVDSAFINNPTNRIVNPETTTTLIDSAGRAVVAVLVTPGKEMPEWNQQRPGTAPADYIESLAVLQGANTGAELTIARDHSVNSNDQLVAIYRDELMPLLYRRVASYAVDLLLHRAAKECPQSVDVDLGIVVSNSISNTTSNNDNATTSECVPSLLVAAKVNSGDRPEEQSFCESPFINNDGEQVIGLESCLELLIEDGMLEGVSADRHWFIKNQWQRHVTITVDNVCLTQTMATCILSWNVDPSIDTEPEGTNESEPDDSIMARAILLHLKGEPHDT